MRKLLPILDPILTILVFPFLGVAVLCMLAWGAIRVMWKSAFDSCELRHRRFHSLKQVEYGGGYIGECSKCNRSWLERR